MTMYLATSYPGHKVPEEVLSLARAWRAANSSYSNPFLSIDFCNILSQARDDVRIFVLRDEKTNKPLVFWPLHVSPSRWARPLAGAFSDRNGPIICPGYTFSLSELLDAFGIDGLVSPGLLSDPNLEVEHSEQSSAQLAVIETDFGSYLAAQKKENKRFFKNLNRSRRKFAEDYPDAIFTFDDKSEDLLQELFDVKQKQYAATNKHNVLGPAWARDMIAELWRSDSKSCRVVLSTMKFNDQLIAAEFNLLSDHYLHGWIVGYNRDFEVYSPGNLLQFNILEEMGGHGITHYDAGSGASYFKYFTNAHVPIYEGSFKAKKIPLTPVAALREMWALMERSGPSPLQPGMGKIRRRADMILGSETDTRGRLEGFLQAALPMLNRTGND